MKILIAFDGSPAAEQAVEEVARRPWPPGSEVRLVTIVDRPFPPTSGVEIYAPVFEQLRSSYREEAYDRLQRCLEKFRSRQDLQTRATNCATETPSRPSSKRSATGEPISWWPARTVRRA